MRDFAHDLSPVQALTAGVRSANANGNTVDLLDYGAAAVFAVFGTWTDGSHTIRLQESDDGTTWTDVAPLDQAGSFAPVTSAAGQNAVQKVSYIGNKRFIRPALAVTGATTGATSGVLVVRGRAASTPVAA